jgi:hypothetical protein
MMPFIMEELAEWKATYARQATGGLAAVLTVTLFFSRFELVSAFFVLAAGAIWLGWMSANRGNGRRNAWLWIARRDLSAAAWVAGRFLVYLVQAAAHLALAAPVIILLAATWGIPAGELLMALAAVLLAGASAVALSLFSGGSDSLGGDLITIALVATWTGAGILFAPLHPLCPFLQVWSLVEDRVAGQTGLWLLASLGFVAACAAVSAVCLGRAIPRRAA